MTLKRNDREAGSLEMIAGGSAHDDRKRRIEEARRAGTRREVKRVLAYAALGAVPVILVGVIVVVLSSRSSEVDRAAKARDAASTDVDLSAVQQYEVVSEHVITPVDYPQSPPAGGAHNPIWLNCGTYNFQPPSENAVHSMEHGAVWITYRPDVDPAEIDAIKALAPASYMIVSPFEDQASPIVASAWGRQLAIEEASDPRLTGFITEYRLGGIAPEAGASCDGASDGTLPLDAAAG